MSVLWQQTAQKAAALSKKYKTNDPFAIAEALGVTVRYSEDFKQLKGMYTVIARNRFIFLNANNGEQLNRIVCAHELGHDRLHREFAKEGPMQELMLFDFSSKMELEANLFAAELLLSDKEVLFHVASGRDLEEIAKLTETDPNLVALKLRSLSMKGYALREQLYENKFLK